MFLLIKFAYKFLFEQFFSFIAIGQKGQIQTQLVLVCEIGTTVIDYCNKK